MSKQLFFVEVTDVFGGEANYAWVTRHVIRASTQRGAIVKFSRLSGLSWRFDGTRYNSHSGATCAFIEPYDPDQHSEYRLNTDERA